MASGAPSDTLSLGADDEEHDARQALLFPSDPRCQSPSAIIFVYSGYASIRDQAASSSNKITIARRAPLAQMRAGAGHGGAKAAPASVFCREWGFSGAGGQTDSQSQGFEELLMDQRGGGKEV